MPKTATENCEVKCDHMPSRVPGLPQTVRSDRVSARILMATAVWRRYGESLTTSATATMRTSPIDDAAAKVLRPAQAVQCPGERTGSGDRTRAGRPGPVICVTSGAWRTRNHAVTSRRTDTKIIASPAPRTARASTATGKLDANANTSCPTVIVARPTSSITRDPKRSSSTPTGICMAAYTSSWRTVKNASSVAAMPKRCVASSPATPSELRWNTARA